MSWRFTKPRGGLNHFEISGLRLLLVAAGGCGLQLDFEKTGF